MRSIRTLRATIGLLGMGFAASATTDGALAFSQDPLQQSGLIDPSEIPSVHNTFYQVPAGVVSWDTLGELDVRTEVLGPLRAVFHTDYSAAIKALDGEDVKLMGFLFPLEGKLEHERFLLTAWPPSCPFCLPAGPTQMVEVFCAEPITFTDGAILVGGRFELLHDDPSGLHYRLHEAILVERYDDIRWTGSLPDQPPAPSRYQTLIPGQ
ncbi:MAG TPA: DUF3299 domain-containing protein [Geminicoccaceae bacterium]|nr:DUF3299 domain-containing protein [Geminicoccaceae bacterium]